jgi:hypothetical protein
MLSGREDRSSLSYFKRFASKSYAFYSSACRKLQYKYVILILLLSRKRVVSSSTIIDVRIVLPAPGIPGQNNVCLSVFSQA